MNIYSGNSIKGDKAVINYVNSYYVQQNWFNDPNIVYIKEQVYILYKQIFRSAICTMEYVGGFF